MCKQSTYCYVLGSLGKIRGPGRNTDTRRAWTWTPHKQYPELRGLGVIQWQSWKLAVKGKSAKRLRLHIFPSRFFLICGLSVNIVVLLARASKGRPFVADACKCHWLKVMVILYNTESSPGDHQHVPGCLYKFMFSTSYSKALVKSTWSGEVHFTREAIIY